MWLLFAVATLVVGVVSALQVRGALEREREFRAAPACASAPVRASACVWEQDFTVRTADMHRNDRYETPEAELTLPSGEPWHVTFRNTDPVLSEMAPGEKVVGLVWRGRVVEVRDAEGRSQPTSVGPQEWPADRLGGALACLSFGLPALVGWVWSVLARGDRRRAAAATVVRWHGVALGGTAILALWAQAANDWPLWAIPAIWGPLALLGLASMTAFTLAALRGELTDEAPATPQAPEPQAT
ncbi:hypothetical protein GCM10010383_33640 [Streptomyces lomondensis]|uniref:DUF3592 domain-containing protein n=2 Tax=Streptomyces lomondensis TaxID=68229 RepID=A0ABQ2X5S0_9ACTN|nr:hypothetical protein GCM10010383_33640 [Streptomyces lomondensis]